jgi:hypothetical protein
MSEDKKLILGRLRINLKENPEYVKCSCGKDAKRIGGTVMYGCSECWTVTVLK